MDDDIRVFIASSEIFSDYSTQISLYNVSSIDDIIQCFKEDLKNTLETNNFTQLKKKLDETSFHIHGYSIEEILTSKKEDVFYICDHE
tara:strand:+ start:4999 stop:5262 length:264 start_codon:yes stop_codon:yes gene_type:complete